MWLLNRRGIERVNHLFITHWHPDHTAGFRVVETLAWDLATGGARACIDVWLNAATLARLGDHWRYFERRGYCRLHTIQPGATDQLGPLSARWFGYAPDTFLTGAVLTDNSSRVIVAMDETKDLATYLAAEPWAQGCDIAVVETGWFLQGPQGQELGPPDLAFRTTEAGFVRDTVPLVRALRPAQAVLVHINGDLVGRTPAELDALAAEYPDLPLRFAHDGLTVTTGATSVGDE